MRRVLLVLSLLAVVSLVLMPLSTLHAHLDDDHHATEVHGGHQHDFDPGAAEVESDVVMDLQITASDRGTRAIEWTQWLPLLAVTAVLLSASLLLASRVRPRAPDIPPLLRRSFWQPPLRGPPLSIPTR